jgi:hypothetical protein
MPLAPGRLFVGVASRKHIRERSEVRSETKIFNLDSDEYEFKPSGVEGLSGFSTDICPVVAVFCCPRAVGSVHGRETVTVKSCQQAQSTSITQWTTLQMLSLNDNFLNVVMTTSF